MPEAQVAALRISDRAIEELKAIQKRDHIAPEKVVRIGVEGGGCSGLSYILDFDDKGELDDEFEIGGLRVVMDPRHALYVHGIEIDYQHGLNDRGFIFNNPNAASTCGCGTSFST